MLALVTGTTTLAPDDASTLQPMPTPVPLLACVERFTNSLHLSWRAMPGSDLFDVHLGRASGVDYLSTTSAMPNVTLDDLTPNTTYSLAVRSRDGGSRIWSNMSEPVVCSTMPLAHDQPLVLPPTQEPSTQSVWVSFRAPADAACAANFTVQYRAGGQRAWSEREVESASDRRVSLELTHLASATAYDVRVLPRCEDRGAGTLSDVRSRARTVDPPCGGSRLHHPTLVNPFGLTLV